MSHRHSHAQIVDTERVDREEDSRVEGEIARQRDEIELRGY